MVRDPRNVLISVYNHFSKKNYEEAKDFLFDENRIIGLSKNSNSNKENMLDNEIITVISSWRTHYRSWKLLKKNFLLIRYEDLLVNSKEEFSKIADYITNFTKIKFSKEMIDMAIEENSFENLSNKENKFGFEEAPTTKTGKRKKFFNLGPRSDWKTTLTKEMVDEINKKFEPELKELNYL